MNCPEQQRATQTMPASAITKNMPVVPGEAELQQHDGRDNHGQQRHAGSRIVGGGRDGVGGHGGEEEGEEQGQSQSDQNHAPGDMQLAVKDGDRNRTHDHARQYAEYGNVAVGPFHVRGFAMAESMQRDAERPRNHAQRFEDAHQSGCRDGANADVADIKTIDLRRRHVRDRNGRRINRDVAHVAANEPDRRD